MKDMKEIIENLADGQRGALATIENGKPDVRPWQFQFMHEGKYYFCTANTKNVFKQLKKNPYAVFTSTNMNNVTVRISGNVVFVDDQVLKEKVIANQANIKAIYGSADNLIFEVFCIEPCQVSVTDLGKPPRRFNF